MVIPFTENTEVMTYRMCVVDDDYFFNKLLTKNIEGLTEQFDKTGTDFVIDSYLSAEVFLKKLTERPDLVILDYFYEINKDNSIPNGGEVLRMINQKFPGTKIIIVSSMKDQHKIIGMIRDGALDFVNKDENTLSTVRYMVKNAIKGMLDNHKLDSTIN